MHQSSSIGGGSYCLLNILKTIDKTQWEPVVALRSEGPLVDELRKLGMETVIFCEMAAIPYNRGLLQRGSLRAYWKVRKSIPALKSLLKKQKIDVVYLNNMMLCRYLQPAKECGCKTVVHIREHWPLDEHKRQLEWARQCVYNFADKMIAINHYSASIFPEKDAVIVYDWIDMNSRYKPMPMSEIFGEDMTGKKVLLYTGGIDAIKGGDYILDTFCNDIKGQDYRLLMLGCNNLYTVGWKHTLKCFMSKFGYHYRELEMKIKMDSDKRIRIIDSVYELSHLIEQSHCFVSYFRMPHANLALAENIILSNPCIAADTEESREYSGDGKYAMLVAPLNNRQAFASALNLFLENHEKWSSAVAEGARVIKEKFDPHRNIKSLLSVLNNL